MPATTTTLARFSTRDLPASERAPFWREIFSREICHIDIEPQAGTAIEADATMIVQPGLDVAWCNSFTPACWKRTPEFVKDGDDSYALIMAVGGAMLRSQRGHDLPVERGDGVGILHAEPASMRFNKLSHIALMLPRAAISAHVANLEDTVSRIVPRGNEALWLLRRYVGNLRTSHRLTDPTLGKLVAAHVCDLVALALGATRDAQHVALARGVRAARLNAVKSDFAANPGLSLRALAERQGVTPRYVQMLFESEGTTFTSYALDRRLEYARQMLAHPNFDAWSISAIAYACGFGDLSHFNRTFKRHFGATPSDMRSPKGR
ncbi:MAG: AraC family transcriptional regulator [Methyloceanibacter sp.]|uniref:helix-turn-helix transcriptional regulator n=1 Tax=Methyloceanibacter sp. TaxID=1965321 RepID=UPI003D6D2988